MKPFSRLIAIVLMALMMISPAVAVGQDATPGATPLAAPGAEAAVTWLIDQQQEDGSWLGFSGEPDAGTTIDAIVSLAAAQEGGVDVGDSIDKAIAWLETDDIAQVYAETGTGQAAKLVLALVASGVEDLKIGTATPLDLVLAGQDAETGLFGFGIYDHAYALMALAATDTEVPANAISFLATVQAENGGFAWDGALDEAMVDSNTTAMVVQALVAVGEGDSDVVTSAVAYLKLNINEQGATYSIGGETDGSSTALVAMALLSVGEDEAASQLITALEAFQNASGAYHWVGSDPTDSAITTMQVIPVTFGVTMPVIPGMLDLEIAA